MNTLTRKFVNKHYARFLRRKGKSVFRERTYANDRYSKPLQVFHYGTSQRFQNECIKKTTR
jgi:hypothetical protein